MQKKIGIICFSIGLMVSGFYFNVVDPWVKIEPNTEAFKDSTIVRLSEINERLLQRFKNRNDNYVPVAKNVYYHSCGKVQAAVILCEERHAPKKIRNEK